MSGETSAQMAVRDPDVRLMLRVRDADDGVPSPRLRVEGRRRAASLRGKPSPIKDSFVVLTYWNNL